jgi:membrane protein YqaA with SNARE-associated domain
MLRKSYNWLMSYSKSPQAPWVLALISFAESSFFPFPPDPLLGAMILSDRRKAWWLALLCTLSSVLGGLLGYMIGFCLYTSLGHWVISTYGLEASFATLQDSFKKWGFWIVALKGLTPIPYKLVTIASGVAHLDLTSFICASLIARSVRFFAFSSILWYYGGRVQKVIEKSLGAIVVVSAFCVGIGFLLFKWVC